jgi:hypothetical protein
MKNVLPLKGEVCNNDQRTLCTDMVISQWLFATAGTVLPMELINEVEFFGVIETKVLRVFLLAIHSYPY